MSVTDDVNSPHESGWEAKRESLFCSLSVPKVKKKKKRQYECRDVVFSGYTRALNVFNSCTDRRVFASRGLTRVSF